MTQQNRAVAIPRAEHPSKACVLHSKTGAGYRILLETANLGRHRHSHE
jgi:hypothetical protein